MIVSIWAVKFPKKSLVGTPKILVGTMREQYILEVGILSPFYTGESPRIWTQVTGWAQILGLSPV